MNNSVILIGGGGHAKVVIDCIKCAGDTVIGILDDSLAIGSCVLDIPVLGKIDSWENYKEHAFLIAIGNNEIRQSISERLNVNWHTAIHPSAIVSSYAKVGEGSVVLPGAVINADAQIGKHCIINTSSVVEHDNLIGDFVHISPAAALAGSVIIGNGSHIGIGANVKNNITVCSGCTVGAGAVVVKDLTEKGTYIGVPARRIK